jgi:phosphoribosylglycinamide formyltransferase-1
MRFVTLASGRGSNVAALLKAEDRGGLDGAEMVGLVVNRPGCGALNFAAAAAKPSATVNHRAFKDRATFEASLLMAIDRFEPELVVLAGFMRILTHFFLDRIDRPVVNLHPSLLPAFPGAKAIEAAFATPVRVSGCSTHLVTPEVDAGPLLMQGAVPLCPEDDLDSFTARIHAMEHRILPATIAAVARGALRCDAGTVTIAAGFSPWIMA